MGDPRAQPPQPAQMPFKVILDKKQVPLRCSKHNYKTVVVQQEGSQEEDEWMC